jgi:hypothetical protein
VKSNRQKANIKEQKRKAAVVYFSCTSIVPIFCLLIFLSPASAHAQGAQQASENSSPPEYSSPRVQWSFTIRNRTGYKLNDPHVLQMSRTILNGKAIVRLSDDWRMTIETRAHFDPVQRLGYPPKLWIDPRQMLIEGKAGRVNLKLGLQQIVWGQADGLRVLDVINPLDYREFILEDFLDSRRPLWAARADVPVGKASVQLVWVPYFAPGRLPAGRDEFSLGESFGLGLLSAAQNSSASIPPPSAITVSKTTRPPDRLSSSQAGVRVSRSVGSWDLTANYFYGWEDTPTPYLGSTPSPPPLPPALPFTPRYDRRAVIGATAANNFGPVVLRLEAGWNPRKAVAVTQQSVSGFRQHGQFSSVIGLDYSPREWLSLSGQYFLQFTSAPQHSLLFPRNNHLASLYVRTSFFRDTLRPELFMLTGLGQRQHLVRPRLTRVISDHWSVSAGGDFLGGRSNNIFGYFGARDRAVIELKWMK